MPSITWMAPIAEGKLDRWRAFVAEMNGARAAQHAASRTKHGITREVANAMTTPMGTFVCLFHEGPDVAASFASMAGSTDEFDVWFGQNLVEIHGLTMDMLAQGPPPVERGTDFTAPATVQLPSQGTKAGAAQRA